MACGESFCGLGCACDSGLIAGSGLSWFGIELLDDRGVCERSENRVGRTPDSNDAVLLLLESSRGGSSDALAGSSTGSVSDLTMGFGSRE